MSLTDVCWTVLFSSFVNSWTDCTCRGTVWDPGIWLAHLITHCERKWRLKVLNVWKGFVLTLRYLSYSNLELFETR